MASDQTETVLGATIAIVIATTISVFLRLWIRATRHDFGVDDYMVAFSWACLVSFASLILMSRTVGLGRNRDDVTDSEFQRFVKYNMAFSATYSWGIAVSKMSFAVLYIRLLPQRFLVNLNRGIIVFLLCQAIEESLITVLQCTPIEAAWNAAVKGRCLDLRVLWWTTFVFNLGTDLALFIQPIPSMWRLQMPKGKRIGLIFMMSLGLLVCAISVLRIVQATRLKENITYYLAEQAIWAQTEVAALLICSCVPILRKLVQKIPGLHYAFGHSSDKASQPYGQSGAANKGSIPLSDYNRRKFFPGHGSVSRSGAGHRPQGEIGIVTEIIVERTNNDSTEEIFSHKEESSAANAVARELSIDPEDRSSRAESWTTESVEHTVRIKQDYQGSI